MFQSSEDGTEHMLQSQNALATLTEKQREVLDLVLQHQSSKEIARALQISPYTVDQRIAAARHKLGAASRGEMARTYAQLRELCGETVYEFPYVASLDLQPQSNGQDLTQDPVYTLSDVALINIPAPWRPRPYSRTGLEALDTRFGIFGRIMAIFGLAAAISLMFLAMVSIAQTLSKML